ncbi:MAG: thioesterase family protein [Micavibrio aeruginosavorus]|uniref:Thioesterase family protein n=1 Tax=Micavibrio aeruginosavorus TaxID=349221 RepID=A0A7T5UHJ3_9BACT|nr:MAG: thioesterase family protein [Micavibrio aeruginosavorus]
MSLFFRSLWVYILSFFRPRIRDILDVATLDFHVLPNDLDTNIHMNNGRYLTIMDLGRFDLVLRTGLLKHMMRKKAMPVLSAAQVRWRLSLNPFQKFTLETRVACWDDKWVYMEQRFIIRGGSKDGAVAAIGIVKGSFYNTIQKATVPTPELLRALNLDKQSPPMPQHIREWQVAEEHLKAVTATDVQ